MKSSTAGANRPPSRACSHRVLTAAAVCLALASLPAAESLGTISGTVLNAVSGAPLASTTVTLTQADGAPLRSFTTDRRGRYLFARLPAGLYAVRASRPGFAPGRHGQKA